MPTVVRLVLDVPARKGTMPDHHCSTASRFYKSQLGVIPLKPWRRIRRAHVSFELFNFRWPPPHEILQLLAKERRAVDLGFDGYGHELPVPDLVGVLMRAVGLVVLRQHSLELLRGLHVRQPRTEDHVGADVELHGAGPAGHHSPIDVARRVDLDLVLSDRDRALLV